MRIDVWNTNRTKARQMVWYSRIKRTKTRSRTTRDIKKTKLFDVVGSKKEINYVREIMETE